MKLGLLTAAFPDTPLTEVADWAAGNGFAALEVACWPAGDGAARRYAGVSHIDVAGLSDAQAKELAGDLAGRGIEISGLGYYPNPLHPDPAVRDEALAHLRVLIGGAAKLGVPVVNTFVGADASRPLRDNIEAARGFLPDLVAYARDHGVKLAIENCPMIFSQDEWPGDLERVVREFGSRLHHVHAKDLQIDREGLYEHGIMSAGIGWQVPRLPGLGEVRWDRFLAALYQAGYDGCVVIEHEDRGFEGSDEKVKAGFLLARNAVAPYVV
jgi:sugar phosphate isomerase/epimerase